MMHRTRAFAALISAALLAQPATAETLKKSAKCVIQLDKDSGIAILAAPRAEPPPEALAYPLTGFGDAVPGDLVVLDRSEGVTLKITSKADHACAALLPVADPHAHH